MRAFDISVGVDGWRKGWVAVVLADGRFERALTAPNLASLLVEFDESSAAVVDIPLVVDGAYPRRVDVEARKFVGSRASSVFNAPHRIALSALTHPEATAASVAAFGQGVTQQAYALRSKILEAQALRLQGRQLFEGHPEVSYRAVAEHDLPSKTSWAGMKLREELLASIGISLPSDIGSAGVVPPDDLLDAAVLAWTARRVQLGTARRLPTNGFDDSGVIWY